VKTERDDYSVTDFVALVLPMLPPIAASLGDPLASASSPFPYPYIEVAMVMIGFVG
jgi:hypothetical protein